MESSRYSVTGRATPVMEGEWGVPPEDPELTKLKLAWVWEAGAHLMGRVTYEEMAGYWPSSSHSYAAPMNEIPEVVLFEDPRRRRVAGFANRRASSAMRSPSSSRRLEKT